MGWVSGVAVFALIWWLLLFMVLPWGVRPIETGDVEIDLAGFRITRAGCDDSKAGCLAASGTGTGIDTTSSANQRIRVRNGTISGMGASGLILGEKAEITGVRLRWNRFDGLFAFSRSVVRDSEVIENGNDGIFVGLASTVAGNLMTGNGDDGVFAGPASTVAGNTARSNGDDGISAGIGSRVSGNEASDNAGDGILAGIGAVVEDNLVRGNGGFGLNLSPTATHAGNVVEANRTGGIKGGVARRRAPCDGDAPCP